MSFYETIRKCEAEVRKLELRALCADGEEKSCLEKKRDGMNKLIHVLRSFDEKMERR